MELTLLVLALLLLGVALFALWRLGRSVERIGERIEEFSALSFLPDRVQALARTLEASDLSGLHERLDRFAEGLARVEDLAAAPPEVAAGPGTRPQAVRARVLRFLREEGYASLRILSESADLEQEPATVRVQALRRGVALQGEVVVEGDEIAEVRLTPHYAAFP